MKKRIKIPINTDRITANENLPDKTERSFSCELFRLLVLMSSHVLGRKLKCFPLEKWGGRLYGGGVVGCR